MNESSNRRAWLSRLLLLPPIAIFSLIAVQNVYDPIAFATARGIVFNSGLGVTIARVGFGAFPLGCALFLLSCFVAERRLLTGFVFVALMDGAVLIVRTIGMYADGSVRESMRLVGAEIVLLVITSVGIYLELRKRAPATGQNKAVLSYEN